MSTLPGCSALRRAVTCARRRVSTAHARLWFRYPRLNEQVRAALMGALAIVRAALEDIELALEVRS